MARKSFPLEQALFLRPDGGSPRFITRSPGFDGGWVSEAEQLIVDFGQRPAGVACPLAVFAYPFGRGRVAVVQVADQADIEAATLGFHFLILPVKYWRMLGDPFALADRHPASWDARAELPTLEVAPEPLPPRTVADVQQVLQRVRAFALKEDQDLATVDSRITAEDPRTSHQDAEGPALLGGAQVLVDGGKLMFERPQPDPGFLRALWTLLPNANRAELWPASFAFSDALGFDAVVVPRIHGQPPPGYTSEDQAADYPQGRYELNLQIAAEAGDQRELDRLFARRTGGQVWRLGLGLIVTLGALVWFLNVGQPPRGLTEGQKRAIGAASIIAVGDPITAISLYGNGKLIWGPRQKANP